jgi:translation initiation factor 5A
MSDKQVQRQPIGASSVKKGTYIMLKCRPVKVAEVKTSKTGKHGHAKCNITGICVLSQNKVNEVFPASHNLTEFRLEKNEYMVTDVNVEKNEISVLDDQNKELVFVYKPANENCKGSALVEAFSAPNASEKTFIMTVIRAPVETGDNVFVDEELIESFKEGKDTL